MIKNPFFTLFFILIFFKISAQTDFRPGYIITSQQDTLFGQIDMRNDFRNSEICDFIEDGKTEKVTYRPFEIEAYRFENGKFYISKIWKNRPLFMEYLVNGKLRLYFTQDVENNHYFIEKDTLELTEIPFSKWLRNDNGQILEVTSKTHLAILNYFTSDAPDFQDEIMKIVEPETENLIKLAEKYHYRVCDDQKCIIYQKQNVKRKFYFGPEVGYKGFSNTKETIASSSAYGGIAVLMSLPKLSERLQFKTGLLLSQANPKNNSLNNQEVVIDVIVPFYLQYTLLNKPSSPMFSFGYNIGKSLSISPAVHIGYMFKTGSNELLVINAGAEFLGSGAIVFIPGQFLAKQIGITYYFFK